MNSFRFEAEIIREEDVFEDVVRERRYGAVRVCAEWPLELATPEIRLSLIVEGDLAHRDAPAFVELFLHDVYLLLNLAAPGTFGGVIAISGGELRTRELALSARVFRYAKTTERLRLTSVQSWFDALHLGTSQVAAGAEATALFQLLHLARTAEDEEMSILRLASAAEALLGRPHSLRRLFELRDSLAAGRTAVFHPMHDDALDPRVEDATSEWIEVADAAAHAVVRELQRRVRGG
jgi:hypothetical protein